MNDQVIKVNLIPNTGTPAVAKVSQYDVGRPLQFVILDGATRATLAAGTRVYIKGTKPSGLGFSVYKILGAGGSTIAFQTNLAMTQECGRIPCELRVVDGDDDIGTANFILAVEKTPHAEGTTDGTQETMQNLETRLQAEIDGLDDRIEALENAEESGLTEAIKSAMLQIARKVAYIDEHGQTYYDALYDALYPPANLVSISAVYTPSGTVYESDSLDSLKSRLVVTAHWSNGTTSEVASANYTLSGTLTMGTSTVTVSYGGMTTTFEVTVVGLTGITATYTQSGTVYDTASLDSLKSDLVVTATFMDSSTGVIDAADYTLSGTLAEGTSVVTVSYGGKTDTFSVTVTHNPYWKVLSVENDFIDGYSNDNAYGSTGIPYTRINTERITYPYFDIEVSSEYTYTFEYDGTGISFGMPYVKDKGTTQALIESHSSINGYVTDTGWKSSGYTWTPEASAWCVRFTFNNTKANILSAGCTELRITREVAS